jgi:hypothetical protein
MSVTFIWSAAGGSIDSTGLYTAGVTEGVFSVTANSGSISGTATVYVNASLLGYWKFDEGSGTVASDSSGKGNHGTLVGGTTWTTGEIGGALDFDGNDDYVDCGNDGSLDLTGDLTIALWFYADEAVWSQTAHQPFISKRDTYASMDWELFYHKNNSNIELWYGNWGGNRLFDALNVSPSTRTWHHLAVTRSGNAWTLWLNGQNQGTENRDGAMPTGDSIRIGIMGADSTHHFNGRIDEVRLYNRALNPLQSIDLNKDGKVDFRDYCRLSQYWLQDEPSVDIAPPPFGDGIVNFQEVEVLAENWLMATTIPPLPEPANNPNPPNGATNVNTLTDLTWTAGAGAASHDVYFGTIDPPPFIANQADTTFNPGTMTKATIYYWRINEVNVWGKTTSGVWSFTTMVPPPPPPP